MSAKIIMGTGEFVLTAIRIAQQYKTLYVMGCFGAPLNARNRRRYCNNCAYNKQAHRQEKINAADNKTYGFDCVCFIKSILWGWYGNPWKTYGGAVYEANGVPDIGADKMIKICNDVSGDMKNIEPGEVVHIRGHIGIYIGNGEVAEATPRGKDGVQISKISDRHWTSHGRLPWVFYHDKREVVT